MPNEKPKEPSWNQVSRAMKDFGWDTEVMSERSIVFQRGRQRIVAKRIDEGNWKIEYYSGAVMDDMAGITETRFAKMEAIEMGFLK